MALNRAVLIPAGIIMAILLLCIYFYFDPSDSILFPKCAFHSLTGLQCPGCGSQRAIHALLHGDIVTAFRFNAMMVVLLPVVVFLCIVEYLRCKYPGLYLRVNSRWVIWGAFIIVTAWWIIRNLVHQ